MSDTSISIGSMLSINYGDVLVALCRAALEPRVSGTYTDPSGNTSTVYTGGLLDPMVQRLAQIVKDDPEFAGMLKQAVRHRIDTIADQIVGVLPRVIIDPGKPAATYSSAVPASVHSDFKVAFEQALVEALTPALTRYVEENDPALVLDKLSITVSISVQKG